MSDPTRPAPMFPVDLDSAPKITLAGRQWAIPQLAIEQARHVVPALMSILPKMGRLVGAVESKDEQQILLSASVIDEPTFDALANATYWSLKRGYPQLGRGEFDQMPISLIELIGTLPVLLKQVGFIVAKPDTAKDAPTAGEA